MLSDLDIIKQSKMVEIKTIARQNKLKNEELFCYGNYMAKVEDSAYERLKNKKDGKLILVTAITPTPTGEGKSTTTIGLVDSLRRIGKKAIGVIREPSLGPVFGIKGGAAGGGYAQVNPMVELNLHFTGDLHAIETANNLISAVIDNHIFQGNELNIDPNRIVWKRCMDLNDRALRKITVGLSSKKETPRPDFFNITVASEIMAIVCLATSLQDLRERIDGLLVAYTKDGQEVHVKDLKITGSVMVLLKEAMKPNLIQTLENNLVIVHGGPFANIAHGCNSIKATRLALKLGDYVVTEAGFGADLGAEKFLDIKCRQANLKPNLVVMVATIKALKYHGGCSLSEIKEPNVKYLKEGVKNLEKHIDTIRQFNINCIVALNKFLTDSDDEIDFMMNWAKENNVEISLSEVYEKGSEGGIDLAQKVVENVSNSKLKYLYNMDDDIETKVLKIAKKAYGASKVLYTENAKKTLDEIKTDEYKNYYICMAKTPTSLSDDPKLIGAPKNFSITIKEIRLAKGAKFIICLTGSIMTMPGLSKEPMAQIIDMDDDGNIYGLM